MASGNLSPFVNVEDVSPTSSPLPGINNYKLFDPSNHNLDLDLPHLVTPAVLSDIPSLLDKCQRKHTEVMQRHCLVHGINVSQEDPSRFLPTTGLLQKALQEAKQESSALLDFLLLIPSNVQPEDANKIKSQMTTFFNSEESRLKGQLATLRQEFVEKAQGRMWTEFVENVEARYYFLFADLSGDGTTRKPFYKRDKMRQYVKLLASKLCENCEEYLKILEGSPSDKSQQSSIPDEIRKSFQCFEDSLKKARRDLLAKNDQHEEQAKRHISKQLIELGYLVNIKLQLTSLIAQDPDSYSTEESIKSVVHGKLKDATVAEIDGYLKLVCLEEFQEEFGKQFTSELEERAKQLVAHGVTFAKQKLEEVDKKLEALVTSVPDAVRSVASGLPQSIMEELVKNLQATVDKTRQDRQDKFAKSFTPINPTAQKHPSPDSTRHQPAKEERKRSKQPSSSSSSTSSRDMSVSTGSSSGSRRKCDQAGNDPRLTKRSRP